MWKLIGTAFYRLSIQLMLLFVIYLQVLLLLQIAILTSQNVPELRAPERILRIDL
jgi:hypothetical protein